MKLVFAALAAVLLAVFDLCALFLDYGKPEMATPIVTLIVGLLAGGAGGYGFGRASVTPEKSSGSP